MIRCHCNLLFSYTDSFQQTHCFFIILPVRNRIPIIQSIFTTTFVVPYLEFVPIQNTKNVQLAASIDKEVHSFEDLLSIIGELPPFLNTTNEEINRFRRAAAR